MIEMTRRIREYVQKLIERSTRRSAEAVKGPDERSRSASKVPKENTASRYGVIRSLAVWIRRRCVFAVMVYWSEPDR